MSAVGPIGFIRFAHLGCHDCHAETESPRLFVECNGIDEVRYRGADVGSLGLGRRVVFGNTYECKYMRVISSDIRQALCN